ncbi:helix-turn-helix domain-containing protein [Raineya sp.]|jgi:transposase
MRKISITSTEKELLEAVKFKSKSPVLRKRCECILLASNLGLTVAQLAEHFSVTRKTIYHWFNLWETSKLSDLESIPGQGAKKKLASISQTDLKFCWKPIVRTSTRY